MPRQRAWRYSATTLGSRGGCVGEGAQGDTSADEPGPNLAGRHRPHVGRARVTAPPALTAAAILGVIARAGEAPQTAGSAT
jgi:hypothetical protein